MKKATLPLTILVSFALLMPLYAPEVQAQVKDPRRVERLIQDLKDESWHVRWSAAEALGEMKDPATVEALIETLKDKNAYVRGMAARALGEIRDRRAIEPLINVLNDEIKDVRRHAAWSLREITAEDFGQDHTKWLNWWKQKK